MPSLNDQFEHGRIPLKPLAYENKLNSQCNELMIDYGENGKYHIYITHHNDPNKYIDITSLIVKEMLPDAKINADQFTITIEGNSHPELLSEIINFIYKRFTYAEDPSGFVYEEDKNKLFYPKPKTISVLLQNTSGQIQLPITLASNVYDDDGNNLQSRLDNIQKLGFSVTYLYTEQDNQTSYEFTYPFEDYDDMMEIRLGTTYVDKSRYSITKNITNGHYTTGTIDFTDGTRVEKGRRLDLVWIFNSSSNISSSNKSHISGNIIANSTIPIEKMEKYSNSFLYPDSNSVATSKALNNLYNTIIESLNDNNNIFFVKDTSEVEKSIIIALECNKEDINNKIINVAINSNKTSTVRMLIAYNGTNMDDVRYDICKLDLSPLSKGFRKNQILKFKIDNKNEKAILLSGNEINTNRYVYTCKDQEYNISFNDHLSYNDGDIINIYRNGVRLFQDLDYSINKVDETITLFVRTEYGERIIFESIGI